MPQEILEQICERLCLGAFKELPEPLTGGFLHHMYSLVTEKGKYAVKLLNPHIMSRETAMENYKTAEKLELLLERQGLPILPALAFQGRKMQAIEGQFFYVYPWYQGKALPAGEITEVHCRMVGAALAKLHLADKSAAPCRPEPLAIDWAFLLKELREKKPELFPLLKENSPLLYRLQERGNQCLPSLPAGAAVCHNDMDSKNVLWRKTDFRIIDLECLSYGNPFLELFETALRWSGYELCRFEPDLFSAFLASYAQAGGELPKCWEALYYGNFGHLTWLEYNIKRALGIGCSKGEELTGISQARKALKQIAHYAEAKSRILQEAQKLSL